MDNLEFINTTKEYLNVANEIKRLDAKKKMLSNKLLEHLKAGGFCKLICEGVGDVQIIHSTKDTPQPKVIESVFKITLTPECFKHTESEYFITFSLFIPIITLSGVRIFVIIEL